MSDEQSARPKRKCQTCGELCAHPWCGRCERALPSPSSLDLDALLRAMFDAGFETCRRYGDNWFHCEGEQRDRAFATALQRVRGHQG